MLHDCITGSGIQLIVFTSSPLTSYGIQVITGSDNFTSQRHFLKVPTRASPLTLAKSIHHGLIFVVVVATVNIVVNDVDSDGDNCDS